MEKRLITGILIPLAAIALLHAADYKAPLANARRGYATISIAWAGRISAPGFLVREEHVKLFWAEKTEDPAYRLTTDWGALDGYHAPSRNKGNAFAHVSPHPWTLDAVDSARNNPWFLATLAARRALTFLEQQPQVDPEKLGVYGHSMGGKLTIFTAAVDAGRQLPLFGDGTIRRDFTHVSDICAGMISALTAENVVGETINLGHSEPLEMREVILSKDTGSEFPFRLITCIGILSQWRRRQGGGGGGKTVP